MEYRVCTMIVGSDKNIVDCNEEGIRFIFFFFIWSVSEIFYKLMTFILFILNKYTEKTIFEKLL